MWQDRQGGNETDPSNSTVEDAVLADPSLAQTQPIPVVNPPAVTPPAVTPPTDPAPPAPAPPAPPSSGPAQESPASPTTPDPSRVSFSAIGSPKVEPVTTATGVFPPSPAADGTSISQAPSSWSAAPAAPPVSPTATPSTAPAFTAVRPIPGAQTQQPAPKKRRNGFFVALAILTVLASAGASFLVASSVADDAIASAPVGPPPTAASAPTDSVVTPSVNEIDASSLADEPFAVAAEIIRPSVVQLDLSQGLGTGVIINSNGTILTAAHVLGNESDVTVTFFDGSRAQGTVVGTDEATDVGVVQIDPEGRDLVVARLADGDDVRVGQIAIAVGSPFGFDQTVTAGIVSAVDRVLQQPGGPSFVQTDAPINPGNSGGPLINLSGEVIGINDLIFTESGSSAGVGFAISIDLAIIIADQLVAGVEPQLARLGVSTGLAPDGDRGALVQEVVGDSAAEAAGLQVGDVVIELNGTNIRGSGDLRALVIDEAPGTDITIVVLRDDAEVELTATLGGTGG